MFWLSMKGDATYGALRPPPDPGPALKASPKGNGNGKARGERSASPSSSRDERFVPRHAALTCAALLRYEAQSHCKAKHEQRLYPKSISPTRGRSPSRESKWDRAEQRPDYSAQWLQQRDQQPFYDWDAAHKQTVRGSSASAWSRERSGRTSPQQWGSSLMREACDGGGCIIGGSTTSRRWKYEGDRASVDMSLPSRSASPQRRTQAAAPFLSAPPPIPLVVSLKKGSGGGSYSRSITPERRGRAALAGKASASGVRAASAQDRSVSKGSERAAPGGAWGKKTRFPYSPSHLSAAPQRAASPSPQRTATSPMRTRAAPERAVGAGAKDAVREIKAVHVPKGDLKGAASIGVAKVGVALGTRGAGKNKAG
eukprot:TRINITY_DN40643_c0_g1_i1.p1 TRINITY_DN40643_c0_g1~~TRINITY_DN40643_c0_g1_i1.p1  ORF type:complete len:392 (-),score=56.23 TRINITY_DN40643_c0_g1_i1:148-1254(-)